MRTHLAHRRAAAAAALIASAALLAACGPQAGSALTAEPSPSAAASSSPAPESSPAASGVPTVAPSARPKPATKPAPGWKPQKGTTLISNGTRTVQIGGYAVTFPTTVTDAVWTIDGRIAFVDGDGNISTAHWDGTARRVLTEAKDGVLRSNLAYDGGQIMWESHSADGTQTVWGVYESQPLATHRNTWADGNGPSLAIGDPDFSGGPIYMAFQHSATTGEEVWIADSNGREPMSMKVAAGTSPALSPDGERVAFVGPDGDVRVVRRVEGKHLGQPGSLTQPVRVTEGAHATGDLAWTADGTKLAYSTAHGIDEVSGSTTAGATHPVTHLSSAPGSIDFLLYS
jgi:WD40-like Beta Propeller Repeat